MSVGHLKSIGSRKAFHSPTTTTTEKFHLEDLTFTRLLPTFFYYFIRFIRTFFFFLLSLFIFPFYIRLNCPVGEGHLLLFSGGLVALLIHLLHFYLIHPQVILLVAESFHFLSFFLKTFLGILFLCKCIYLYFNGDFETPLATAK